MAALGGVSAGVLRVAELEGQIDSLVAREPEHHLAELEERLDFAERLLAKPVEKQLRDVEGVKEMRSTSFLGGANVVLEFNAGFDVDVAMADVREKVDQAKPDLPEDADEPTVHEINLSLFPVLLVTLSGDVPERSLLRLARRLQDRVEQR